MKRATLVLFVSMAVLLSGCGKKGVPVPPERRLPAPVTDLAADVKGSQVTLIWTNPKERADKSPLKDLAAVHVFRRADAPGVESRPAIGDGAGVVGFERVGIVELQRETPETRVEGRQGRFVDQEGLLAGRRYTYVVTAVNEARRSSPPSNRVVVNLRAAPRAPADVRAEAGDGWVQLSWQPPGQYEDGSRVVGPLQYHVFRTTAPDAPRARPHTVEPLTATAFLDLAVENERTYYYTVRAIRSEAGSQVQSQDSSVVAAIPEDTTPPEPPRNPVAVPVPGGVRLAWEASPGADVAGYIVHRSTIAGRGYSRLMERPQPGTTFVDPDVRRGETYYYVVTAVDRSRRANESVPSVETRVTIP